MLLLLVSGLYLWWPLKRVSIGGAVSGRGWWFGLHNAIGFFSLLFLLVLTTTGLMIGFDEATVPMLYQVTGTQPAPQPQIPPPPPDAAPIPPDQAMEIARRALPGTFPFQINVPGPKGGVSDSLTLSGEPHRRRRPQPGGGGPVHRAGAVRGRLAHGACRGAPGDPEPRAVHRMSLA
jgi:uncharacterized iron-regulated membrane protein